MNKIRVIVTNGMLHLQGGTRAATADRLDWLWLGAEIGAWNIDIRDYR